LNHDLAHLPNELSATHSVSKGAEATEEGAGSHAYAEAHHETHLDAVKAGRPVAGGATSSHCGHCVLKNQLRL
jgi:hypothetical protein